MFLHMYWGWYFSSRQVFFDWNSYLFLFLLLLSHRTCAYFTSRLVSFHAGCWENTRKAEAEGEWFTSFLSVLPTSQVAYHAGKPMESVVCCFYKIASSFLWVYRHNKPYVFNQSIRAYYLSYFITVFIIYILRNTHQKAVCRKFSYAD